MRKLTIKGDHKKIQSALFSCDDNGHIKFGWTGRSSKADSIDALVSNSQMEFTDYIMEGGVKYLLEVQVIDGGLLISIEEIGTNRDEFILPQIRQYIKAAGYEVGNEETI